MKRLVYTLTVILLYACIISAQEIEGIKYSITSESTVKVIANKYKAYQGNIILPYCVMINNEEYMVDEIGTSAFENCANLLSISLPETLTKIDHYAFSGCSSLTEIVIPESVTLFGWEAFYGCSSLKSVKFNAVSAETYETCYSLNEDQRWVFNACNKLENVIIGEDVLKLPAYLFFNCKNLKEVLFNNKIEEIGSNCFKFCLSLKNITLPESCLSVGENSFMSSGVEYVTLPGITEIGDYAFQYCADLKNIETGGALKSIGCNAFQGCEKLETIFLPETTEVLGIGAFMDCSGLKSITCIAVTPPETNGVFTFRNVNSYIPLYVSDPELYAISGDWSYFSNISVSKEFNNYYPDLINTGITDINKVVWTISNDSYCLNINTDNNNGTAVRTNVEIYNASGKLFISDNFLIENNYSISISDLIPGIYLVRLNGEIYKIIK